MEQKLATAYSANDNELINQFNVDAGIIFLEKKLRDLSVTYEESTPMLVALRSFLGSIFLSGFAWQYPGYSNCEISPLYQSIRQFDDPAVSISCGTWIRTKINRSRIYCPTVRRSRNINFLIFFLNKTDQNLFLVVFLF